MIKAEELSNPESCLNRAEDDEMVFVLLGRDLASPSTIRAWIAERLRLGKNQPDDAQILDARAAANKMEADHLLGKDRNEEYRRSQSRNK